MKKIICMFCLVLLPLCPIMAQTEYGGGYNPINPPDPNAPKVRYTLSIFAEPQEGGYTNIDKMRVAENDSVYLNARSASGFVFKEWDEAGVCISNSSSFYYKMPGRNASLICVFEYNPESPADPQFQEEKFILTVSTTPFNAGSVNISNSRFSAGELVNLYALPNSDYSFREWQQNGETISTEPFFSFIMPSESTSLIAVFEYNPANPENPGGYTWNTLINELVIDDCRPGLLSNKILSALQSNYLEGNEVQKLIVLGDITSSDLASGSLLPNCKNFDFYRTSGLLGVPSNAFNRNKSVKTIILPESVEMIAENAFRGCTELNTIYCYAQEPPFAGLNVFDSIDPAAIAYVPATSLDAYATSAEWSKLVLRPIVDQYGGFLRMTIWHSEAENRVDVLLNDIPIVTFDDEKMYISTNVNTLEFLLSDFNKITYHALEEDEYITTNVPIIAPDSLNYSVTENNILFNAIHDNSILYLYSVDGRVIDVKMGIASGYYAYPLGHLPKGVYCVVFDSITFKVFVK